MPGIVLECAQFGDFDSFDVIRSLTSMAGLTDAELPTPIATGLPTMYYVDTTVVEGETYYYKFRVWRDGVALVSDELRVVSVSDPFEGSVVCLMRFEGNLRDEKGNVWIPLKPDNTYLGVDSLIVEGVDQNGLYCSNTQFLDFGTTDFCFEFLFIRRSHQNWEQFYCSGSTSWGGLDSLISTNNKALYYAGGTVVTSSALALTTGVLEHYAVTRSSGLIRLFYNGVKVMEEADSSYRNYSHNGAVLFGTRIPGFNSPAARFKGVRITKGNARYTAAFTPPTQF